ncbi:MAG: TIGR01212 family radical SAM protein [Bacteroidales bacterium]|jgi:radical SAM protein (TIGR01212 family)|nr:TIGR01212 family radical SAM protein [Bacteroidales bacterium]
MENSFPWGHSRPFNSYNEYFKRTFGGRVQKLSIDAGFTCPNRDGSKGTGGCTYCNNDAFNPSYCTPQKSIRQQIEEGKQFHAWRYRRAMKYLAYFQAYSNTHAPLNILKEKYQEALSDPDIIGLVIGTRPDCINEEKLEYIASLAKENYIIIEYGIESVYDRSLEKINRGHSWDEAKKAIQMTAAFGIRSGAHFIFGLSGESRQEMMEMSTLINELKLDTIKFHQLQIIRNTPMAKEYQIYPEQFEFFNEEEYIRFISEFTSYLNSDIVIERFSGEAPPPFVIAPDWGRIRADEILRKIENYMIGNHLWQGKYVSRPSVNDNKTAF